MGKAIPNVSQYMNLHYVQGTYFPYMKVARTKYSSQWSAVIKLICQFAGTMLFSLIYTELKHVLFY